VVPKLLARTSVAPGGLYVTARIRADPHRLPRWRDGENRDPMQNRPAANEIPGGVVVLEA
jgi:hypothetical protein